ncbi:MAG: hypothetical protein M1813_006755 [Trichoglossum hirsutum]|nr:MAG: hypothetical protein M1813_006755 [Trichoglossum hirsutum]
MSESDVAACGIIVLPGVIPDSVIREAASKIDDEEVDSRLRDKISSGPKDRVPLQESKPALDSIYQAFRDGVDKTLLARLMGTDVVSVAAQTPLKLITLHLDNPYDKFWDFGKDYSTYTVVVIPIRQLPGVENHEYVKGSHRTDHKTLDFSNTVPVPLEVGQILIYSSGLVFKNIKRTGEICAMFIYK